MLDRSAPMSVVGDGSYGTRRECEGQCTFGAGRLSSGHASRGMGGQRDGAGMVLVSTVFFFSANRESAVVSQRYSSTGGTENRTAAR